MRKRGGADVVKKDILDVEFEEAGWTSVLSLQYGMRRWPQRRDPLLQGLPIRELIAPWLEGKSKCRPCGNLVGVAANDPPLTLHVDALQAHMGIGRATV